LKLCNEGKGINPSDKDKLRVSFEITELTQSQGIQEEASTSNSNSQENKATTNNFIRRSAKSSSNDGEGIPSKIISLLTLTHSQ
jgi:hypothetical protein